MATLVESKRTGISLYPFQSEDMDALEDRKGILLAWEMGTGKTVAAIERDIRIRQNGFGDLPTLIVAPLTTLYSTWVDHLERFAPEDLSYIVIDPKDRTQFTRALKDGKADYYVCHWESLRLLWDAKDKNGLKKIMFGHVIADEVHRAKSRKAQQTRALKRIRTKFKTGLSGTPVTNKPYDLWSILNWLYPTDWRSYWRFYEEYCDYKIEYPHGYHKFLGPKNEKQLLRKIRPYYRRHLKKAKCCEHHPQGVQPQLPEKYYDKIWVQLSPKQRRAYDQMKKEMIAWLETQDDTKPIVAPVAIAQLTRLMQFAVAYADIDPETNRVVLSEPSSKLDVLMQIIEDNPDEPIVIFSSFKQLIHLAAARLQKAGIKFVGITGDTSTDERRSAVEAFQSGRAHIFLGTIGAGGEGITLTAASTIIFLDRDWSPAKNAQAEDRLHRIGQVNSVHVIDIMARSTVDLGRHQKLELKKSWIRQILGDS